MGALIGIDASRSVSRVQTGTEGYSYHLIRALLPLLADEHTVRLYFRQPPDAQAFAGADLRVIPFPRLWTHLRLSWELLCYPPDLLFVPAHVLPPLHPRRSLVTVHDLGYRVFPEAHPRGQRVYLDGSTRWNVQAAAHVLADSAATRADIVQAYGVPEEKITVVYPGYDRTLHPVADPQTLAQVRARYDIPGPYILTLGRIQPRKNLVRLIEAFARLLPEHPELMLVLAGPVGWLSEPIVARVHEFSLDAHVRFPGYVAEEDKAALLSGASLFAFPSLYEGFGFPVLEAQACGVPVLASTTSSLPEVVGEGGLLVDPLDVEAIAEGMARLLRDEPLRRTLVARGTENLARFSWEQAARAVAAVITGLL